jgi:hypothetical protein
LRERRLNHLPALSVLGHVCGAGCSVTTLLRDHLDRPPGKIELPVHNQNTHSGACEQDGGRSTIADAVSRGAAAGDYGHLALEAEAIPRF